MKQPLSVFEAFFLLLLFFHLQAEKFSPSSGKVAWILALSAIVGIAYDVFTAIYYPKLKAWIFEKNIQFITWTHKRKARKILAKKRPTQ